MDVFPIFCRNDPRVGSGLCLEPMGPCRAVLLAVRGCRWVHGAGPSKDGGAHEQLVCGLAPGSCGGALWTFPGRLNSPRVIVAASVLSVTNEERLALLASLSGYSHF